MNTWGLVGDGGRGDKCGGVSKVERREDGDGLGMRVERGGSSPSEESERFMTVCILGSILTLTTGWMFKVEAEEWRGVRMSVHTFVEKIGRLYTLYLREPDTKVKERDRCKTVRIHGENSRDSKAIGTELNHV